jgi:hypothetical protein
MGFAGSTFPVISDSIFFRSLEAVGFRLRSFQQVMDLGKLLPQCGDLIPFHVSEDRDAPLTSCAGPPNLNFRPRSAAHRRNSYP